MRVRFFTAIASLAIWSMCSNSAHALTLSSKKQVPAVIADMQFAQIDRAKDKDPEGEKAVGKIIKK